MLDHAHRYTTPTSIESEAPSRDYAKTTNEEYCQALSQYLKLKRFVVSFDFDGKMEISTIDQGAYILTPKEFTDKALEFMGMALSTKEACEA